MRQWTWLALFVLAGGLYTVLVMLVGFEGFVAYAIHFSRVAVGVAVLAIYLPAMTVLFQEIPPPRRDYLLAGILLTWLSAISFAVWNEMGRSFGMVTSIFLSPVAGFFSLLLVLGGLFHFLAPGTSNTRHKLLAISIAIVAALVVTILPLFF